MWWVQTNTHQRTDHLAICPSALLFCLSLGDIAKVCGWRVCGDTQYKASSSNRREVFLRLFGRHGWETWNWRPRDCPHLEDQQVRHTSGYLIEIFNSHNPLTPFTSLWPMSVSLQSPSQVLGQHPEEPSVRSGRSGDRQHRRRSVCHRSDLHRLLHHLWAQSGTGKNSLSRSAWLCIGFCFSVLFSRLHGYFLSNQDSPVNKLLYAREIPRYKQLVERWDSFLSPLFNS